MRATNPQKSLLYNSNMTQSTIGANSVIHYEEEDLELNVVEMHE